MGGVGGTSPGDVDGSGQGQLGLCARAQLLSVLVPCTSPVHFPDIPRVCFALCCPGSRRTQPKDPEWPSESSPGGEAEQQPDLSVRDAAGEGALGRRQPGPVSPAAPEVQKHQGKDRCPLCGCH